MAAPVDDQCCVLPNPGLDELLNAVPGLARELVDRLVGLVETLRRLNLKKPPSVSETIDLARTLHLLGATDLDVTDSSLTLNVLLKYRDDVQIAEAALTPRQWKKRA